MTAVGPPAQRHHMAALAYPGMAPFELAIAIEVFGLERPELDVVSWYSVDVCAVEPGEHPAVGGITLTVPHGLDRLSRADTVIIPGWPVHEPVPEALSAAVRRAHERGSRVVSICSGAFVLAAAGLLDGRRAATHWQYAERLARTYPAVDVDLIRRDHGAAVANQVARRLVVPAHRDGGQSQYVERPVAVGHDARIHDVIAGLEHSLTEPVTIGALARRAHLSERHFTRRFREVTGQSPIEWLLARRVDRSLELLERGDQSIDEIATVAGFANATTYRLHFRHRMNTTPSQYRRAFRR
jgi:AraC family transcriptional activator FtrA